MAFVRIYPILGYLLPYLAALALQQLALPGDTGSAFFWPASGIAVLWVLRGASRRQVVRDGLVLVLSTTLVDVLLGVDLAAAVLFGLANLAIGLTVRIALSSAARTSLWTPPSRRLAGPRDLVGLAVAILLGAVVGAAPGLAGVYAETGPLDQPIIALWLVRSACSTFVVVAAVLGLLTAVMRAHARRGWSAILTPQAHRFWRTELVVLTAVSVASGLILFTPAQAQPIAFVMIVTSTWVGCRFSPVVGGLYTTALASLAALCTQDGRGPFGSIEDLTMRATTVQVYALMTSVVVLLLSLGVTERAALLARVFASEARATERADLVDAVTTVMTDGLSVIDGEGRVLLTNPAAERMAGLRTGSPAVANPSVHGVFRMDGTAASPDELPRARALRGESVPPMDLLRIDPLTGQRTILSVSAVPLRLANQGSPAAAVVLIRDVTKARAQRRELENFAGVVAHDLKSPLSGLISWAEILEEQLGEAGLVGHSEVFSSLSRISGSADRMSSLISDLLDYSQTQNATLSPQSLSLDEMVDQIAHDLRGTHRLEVPVVEHGPLGRVLADRTLVRQLLTNVLGNAVKYVAPGVIPHIVIDAVPMEDMLEICVSDNGIGIPEGDLGHVFDSFFRASSTQDYPGTGLGLAICANTVERHGGRISARRGPGGEGTSMIFTLPLDPASEPQEIDAGDLEPLSATS